MKHVLHIIVKVGDQDNKKILSPNILESFDKEFPLPKPNEMLVFTLNPCPPLLNRKTKICKQYMR